ncbi:MULTISPECIES: F0F1 ATP synthase subunit delta [Thiorhodovibrio]|uniref:F0F1 ATP synthase subunit delta n=1 Tax=Thiorhodovibrio TaxID=61593 RepID=UPI001912157A|nr:MULTISPECIES: F0F1 ATP synthase subunit delta [Thiorhodovibrio]MBK5967643.1 F0F1 ATP synthase subunit delta [Thiorhodovibrio winogradskyi]WPL13052.1 F-type ATPase subunit delta [Thiorhodovibrio litoralis]
MAGDFTTIARPYAEAAFALAKAEDALEPWSQALMTLGAIAADPQLDTVIGNPNVAREQLCDLVLAVATSDSGANALPSGPANLVRLLANNDRLPALPEIARMFDLRKTAEQGVRKVLVRSAFPLDDQEQQGLITSLKAHFGAEVELSVEQDENLIGGVEIRADDLVIDSSIRGKLQQLSNELQF